MNPNQTQPPATPPPAGPEQSSFEQPTPQPPVTPAPNPTTVAVPAQKKSHVGLIIGLIVGFLALLLIGGVIIGLVFSSSKSLSEKAKTTAQQSVTRGGATITYGEGVSEMKCLTASDIRALGSTSDPGSAWFNVVQVGFQPDSAELDSAYSLDDSFSTLGPWAAERLDKKFRLTITPSTNESTPTAAGEALAKQRANVIRDYLISKGVTANKITITESSRWVDDQSGDRAASRNVQTELFNVPECQTDPSATR